MISLSSYLTFITASVIVAAMPGPGVLLITTQTITLGRKAMFPLIAGIVLGDLLAMTLALVSVGTLLHTFPFGFTVLRYLGAAYLIFLGIQFFRYITPPNHPPTLYSPFLTTFMTTAFNPKSLLFFTLFMAPFIEHDTSLPLQLLLLGGTYLIIGAINACGYIIAADKIMNTITPSSAVSRLLHWTGGLILIGVGLWIAIN